MLFFCRLLLFFSLIAALGRPAPAQWNPLAGSYGKSVATHVRVMSWNVKDALCSSNVKTEGANNWTAMARIVAAFKPDVLFLLETADNNGNGTGSTVDSVANLTTTIGYFLHGGNDSFHSGSPAVTAYVQAYAPGYDLPYVFVSSSTDGFNRNVILSRFPMADLNGDGRATMSDMPTLTADLYAPGGNGGIRGYAVAELSLPNATYAGDLVVATCHLKAGGASSDHTQRITAAKNIAYFIEYFYNGAGTGIPDPRGKFADSPPATSILSPNTAFITGGDWNEDELTNGTQGPADWITRAQDFDSAGGSDGTDRDHTDMSYDSALDLFNGSRSTGFGTKYDYIAFQDSMVAQVRAFLFNSAAVTPAAAMPPELSGFSGGAGTASGLASDHYPVIVDFALPLALPCNSAAQDLGFARYGSNATFPRFSACGQLSTGQNAVLTLSGAPANAACYAGISVAKGILNVAGGTLIPVAPSIAGPFYASAAGSIVLALPGGGGPIDVYAQWGIVDPGVAGGLGFSNGLALHFLP